MSSMFGVFIRSVGERTEQLCYESCIHEVPREHVHVLKGLSPSRRVYEEMFLRAGRAGYRWYLGVDADVVLQPGWHAAMVNAAGVMNDFFALSFAVEDPFLGRVDRGNHLYNGAYTTEALDVLRIKTWALSKPESTLEKFVNASSRHFDDVMVGYHGYEQFAWDIYRRFWMQYRRGLRGSIDWRSSGVDAVAAKAGWTDSRWDWWLDLMTGGGRGEGIPDAEDKRVRRFFDKRGIVEKLPLSISLEDFYAQQPNHS